MSGTCSQAPHRVIFSDIDGTIMHEPPSGPINGSELLVAPPSTSGRQGVISVKTLQQVAALRSQGAKFVVISGARMSTVLMRLPCLPAADAFVCENGGRIIYPGSAIPSACPLTEDEEWRASHDHAAGPCSQQTLTAEQRQGPLWDWYRQLKSQGWHLDGNGYTTSFRVSLKNGQTQAQLDQLVAQCPSALRCSFNLGMADFYPNTSGKVEAARHLMKKFGALPEDCVFLCDDDNDMELAAVVGKAFLPSITSESVAQAVRQRPDHFTTSSKEGTEATEEMLEAVAAHYGLADQEYSTATEAFLHYLSAYNAHNLHAVLAHLHTDCEVVMDGQVVLKGRDAMKETYVRDWSHPLANSGAAVKVVGEIDEVTDDAAGNVCVNVQLLKESDGTKLDVTYVFELLSGCAGRMLRHIISNVVKAAES